MSGEGASRKLPWLLPHFNLSHSPLVIACISHKWHRSMLFFYHEILPTPPPGAKARSWHMIKWITSRTYNKIMNNKIIINFWLQPCFCDHTRSLQCSATNLNLTIRVLLFTKQAFRRQKCRGQIISVFFIGRGWDQKSACNGTTGNHYQSIVDLTHPTHALLFLNSVWVLVNVPQCYY